MLEILVILVTTLVGVWWINDFLKFKNRPPGPSRLPWIGTLLSMVKGRLEKQPPYVTLQELSQKYGPVMSLQTGVIYQVVINEFEILKQILTSDVWVDRVLTKYVMERSFGKPLGIIFTSGDGWKEMRRFTTRTLRDFGFGRQKSMETVIAEELEALKSHLEDQLPKNKTDEGVISLKQFFTVSVLNILWSMIAGHRFCYDNEKLQELIGLIDEVSKANPISGNISMAFPTLGPLVSNFTESGRRREELHSKLNGFFDQLLQERRRLGQYQNSQKDFVDVFLKEIDDHRRNNGDEKNNFYTDQQFTIVTVDLFEAGSETTSNTLEFAFLYMMLNPKVQKKCQEEIDRVVGRQRAPSTADKSMMPYVEATILEVQRLANVLPLVVRSNTQDTKIGDYDVPKGAICVLNTYSCHLNENFWPDPFKFKPERFLDSEGTSVVNAHRILPFGLGKRVCLGEVLARATIFTYFTTMLQSYNFDVSPGHPTPTTEPDVGFTLSPRPYFAKISRR